MGFTTNLFELPTSFTTSRMNSLYSDFRRIEESNPEGFSANIAAWKTALLSALGACEHFPDSILISAGSSLVNFFDTNEHGTPLALDAVLDELVKDKDLIPLPNFLATNRVPLYQKQTWLNWATPRPTAIASWALQKAGLYNPDWKSALKNGRELGTLKKEKYVSVTALETVATALLNTLERDMESVSLIEVTKRFRGSRGENILHDSKNKIFTMGTPGGYTRTVFTKDMFYATYSRVTIPPRAVPYSQYSNKPREIELSPTDLDVLIVYLTKDVPKLSIKDDTIKLQLSVVNERDISPVTEKDRAVANMRSTVEEVIQRVDTLTVHIDSCDQRARQALESKSSNRTSLARYAVRSRKLALQSQEAALGMLTNLEKTLLSIDTAESNTQVMEALQNGVGILNSLNKEIGGAEKVAELMDELDDEMADTEDIGRQIGALASSKIDEGDVDDELEALLKQEQGKTREQPSDSIPEMPKVPASIPKSSPSEEEAEEENMITQLEGMLLE